MLSRPKWRNWQTRRTQNPVPSGECGFDSHLRHSLFVELRPEAGPGVVLGLRVLLVAVGDRRGDLRLGFRALRLDHRRELLLHAAHEGIAPRAKTLALAGVDGGDLLRGQRPVCRGFGLVEDALLEG